jgi:hypothetical protein
MCAISDSRPWNILGRAGNIENELELSGIAGLERVRKTAVSAPILRLNQTLVHLLPKSVAVEWMQELPYQGGPI